MSNSQVRRGYVDIDECQLYYETAGSGIPLLLVHAGVADCEQWENEFLQFSQRFQVVRYDMRGYGKSSPVKGPFCHLEDLKRIAEHLRLPSPMVVMGCSMGGILSMEYALDNPDNMLGLIMIGPGPCGFEMDIGEQELFLEAMRAFKAGDLTRLAEIETQIWFESMDLAPDQVDQSMRALLYDMHQSCLEGESSKRGQSGPMRDQPEYKKMAEVDFPVLIIIGSQDLPSMRTAAEYMEENFRSSKLAVIGDAAHLPNLDQPLQFQQVVEEFLDELTSERDYDTMLP
jgi:pimeloyl-ACP methyl ester carboxylesterase